VRAIRLGGGGDEQIHHSSAAVLSLHRECGLNIGGVGEHPIRHRHPAEGSRHKLDKLVAVFGGARGKEQLKLNDRTGRHKPGGNLLFPTCSYLGISQDPDQGAGIEEEPYWRQCR
jgi:hypothetical protein